MGLCGKVLVVGGLYIRVASVSRCQKLPPCLIKPMPDRSKTDLSLAKAKPIINGGSVSGITYLRRERNKTVVKRQMRERSETM